MTKQFIFEQDVLIIPGLVVFRKLQSDAVKPEREGERERGRERGRERERGKEKNLKQKTFFQRERSFVESNESWSCQSAMARSLVLRKTRWNNKSIHMSNYRDSELFQACLYHEL